VELNDVIAKDCFFLEGTNFCLGKQGNPAISVTVTVRSCVPDCSSNGLAISKHYFHYFVPEQKRCLNKIGQQQDSSCDVCWRCL